MLQAVQCVTYLPMAYILLDIELGTDACHAFEASWAPLFNRNFNTHLIVLAWSDCLKSFAYAATCVHFKNGVHNGLHDDRASHLPDRDGAALDEVLDTVGAALVDKRRALT